MLFTSLGYLIFLPAVALAAWALPGRARLPVLVLASLGFYASFGLSHLVALGAVAAVALAAGRRLAREDAAGRGAALWAGGGAILALMWALKYHDAAVGALGLPLELGLEAPPGFSFYACTAIALLADRYRQARALGATPGQELLLLAWFPKILAGPIERAKPFAAELAQAPRLHPALVAGAAQLIVWGLVKKVVVADNLAPFVDRAYAAPAYLVPMELLLATYFFAFQIYCDFSGYTDIARGSSRLFGIELNRNFRRAYFATSIGTFWSERWHISLSQWFRDYLFRPLLGRRAGPLRVYAAIMVVFVVSGVWHAGLGYGIGAGFVVWGALNGIYLCAERGLAPWRARLAARLEGSPWARVHAILAAIVVFHLVLVSWIFFRAGGLSDGVTVARRIWAALPELPGLVVRYPFTAEHGFLAALVAGLLLCEAAQESRAIRLRLARAPRALRWAGWYAALFALVLIGRWQGESFVYMQF
ncbi:MBOAT family protein [Rhodosalinus sp. FB01]|uniref:MBOAT family O-acyltransferase n=1 Tax=Rhodosalinus sp. FB01 TaxID=3239194 RepID=UPI0035268554